MPTSLVGIFFNENLSVHVYWHIFSTMLKR